MMNNKKLIIFDLDGTLLNSLKDIALAANHVLQSFGVEEHPIEAYRDFVGDGAKALVQRALPKEFLDKQIEKALEIFKEVYSNKINDNTKPYEGIYDMLDALEELCEFALLSNKPHKFTVEYMDIFFKRYDFKVIHGQKDEVPKKPDPAGALYIMDKLGYDPKNVFYIGDTATDMKTAVNAGMIPVGVLWGYQDKEYLVKHGARYLIDKPEGLVDIVLGK
jgi:phosphoglycolate phosphatase